MIGFFEVLLLVLLVALVGVVIAIFGALSSNISTLKKAERDKTKKADGQGKGGRK